MAVAARIGNADHAAVGQSNAGRALDVDDEGLDPALQEYDRPGALAQRAVLNGGAVGIRLVARVRVSGGLKHWIETGQGFALAHRNEVVGPGEQRRPKTFRLFERTRILRLEVAG